MEEITTRMLLLQHISDYMERHLVSGLPTPQTCRSSGQELVKWHRSADAVALQLSGSVLQVNSLSNHEKEAIWRLCGDLILTLISPGGVPSSHKLGGPWSPMPRLAVKEALKQLGKLAVCGNT